VEPVSRGHGVDDDEDDVAVAAITIAELRVVRGARPDHRRRGAGVRSCGRDRRWGAFASLPGVAVQRRR